MAYTEIKTLIKRMIHIILLITVKTKSTLIRTRYHLSYLLNGCLMQKLFNLEPLRLHLSQLKQLFQLVGCKLSDSVVLSEALFHTLHGTDSTMPVCALRVEVIEKATSLLVSFAFLYVFSFHSIFPLKQTGETHCFS